MFCEVTALLAACANYRLPHYSAIEIAKRRRTAWARIQTRCKCFSKEIERREGRWKFYDDCAGVPGC